MTGFRRWCASGTLRSLRDSDWTKILGWPGYRVWRSEINEPAKRLKLWVRRKRGNQALVCSGCGRRVHGVAAVYERAYAGAAFVRPVGASLPEIKHVVRTNFCDIGWKTDVSGRAVLVSVIDNLVKGAAGQAVQNMNVMLGLDETTGLL